MAELGDAPGLRRLTTPRSAAVAGLLFALLFSVSLVMLRIAIPPGPRLGTAWLGRNGIELHIGLTVMPIAGIAFLWFVGVVRDRIGALEDRFFSTVFFGSGLLFLAMAFVATATAGALDYAASVDPGWVHADHVAYFGRALMLQLGNVYAPRMASVLMISLATIWLRTRLMPRWLVAVTYLLAAALLVVVSADPWVALVFPAWVFLVSLMILHKEYSATSTGEASQAKS
jgi:hypothetical protein